MATTPAVSTVGVFQYKFIHYSIYKTSKMIKSKAAPKKINGSFQYRKLAECILTKRNEENLTFKDMSSATGVAQGTCYRAEAIATGLDIDTVIAICNWIGKPVQFFIEPTTKANVKKDKN